MIKKVILFLLIVLGFESQAQVGINTTDPKAQLEIKSTNEVTPANTDGLLIPKINAFPVTNPTADQQGMLVYLTTTVGAFTPGFYYWNNPTVAWIPIGNNNNSNWKLTGNSGTNSATNFIGTTDDIDLVFKRFNVQSGRISNSNTFFGLSSGSVSTATNNTYLGTEAGRDNITGQQNVFIGRRTGTFGTTGSDNVLIGNGAGISNSANQNAFVGSFSGNSNSTGVNNSFFGYFSGSSTLTGARNTFLGAFAGSVNTVGTDNTIIGSGANVSANNLTNASAIGASAQVGASNSLVLGSIIGINSATATVNVGIGTTSPLDRLHVVGNLRMVDGNEATGKVLTSDANGTATWTTAGSIASGTLDQAYDFGGAGLGRTITADSGAVTISGTDGLVSTGTIGSGALAPSGGGTRMVWNPRKAAFRAGSITGTGWNDANIGQSSVAFGEGTIASGNFSTAFGSFATASGAQSVSFGTSVVASGDLSTAFGAGTLASGSTATSFGNGTTASGGASTAFGNNNTASGGGSTAFGILNTASGLNTTTFGVHNGASSYAETVIGIGATTYTPSTNGATQFRTANATDRLFVIGNAIDTNNNSSIDLSERSDAMVVLKNGNTGIGSSTPQDKLHVVGNIRMVDGNQAAGKVLTSDVNGTATWQNASANAWGLTGNTGTNSANNFIGTTDDTDLVFRRFNLQSGRISNFNTFFGILSGSVSTATNNTYLGTEAGMNNITGQENVFIGRGAGAIGISGSSNVLIGIGAGIFNEANQNTFVGSFSGNANSTGGNNSFFGHSSGAPNSTGARNTFFGAFTGNGNTIGTDNTIIGAGANVSANNLTNASAIGASALVGASNSLVLGSVNGVNSATATVNVGIGTTTPLERLHVAGRAFLTDGFSADNAALVYRNNTDYMFLGPQSGSSANGGAMALFGSTNTAGGNAGGVDFNAPGSQVRMNHTNGSYVFRANSTSGYTATFELNDVGLQMGHNSASRAILFNTDSTERMRLTAAGRLGIGTPTPGGQFELSLNEGRKPTSNTWTIPSDARLKNVDGIYQKGLTEILQLKPIRYHYKNTDKKSFESKVLEKEAYGFLAQEVQQIFPEAVGTDEDGYLNFDLHPILVAYTNAFKELDLKNQSVENKNRELELKLKSQEQIINNLIERLEKLEAKN